MLTKIKNFVKKAFKKVKEVIMNTAENVIDIARKVVNKPEAKPFVSFAAPKVALVSTLALAVCYIYYHFNEESIDNAYYANEIRKIKARQEYLKAIDIL